MQKIYCLIIVAVVLALTAVWLPAAVQQLNEANNQTGQGDDALQMSVEPISQTDDFYSIQVEYPQFKNADDFNQKISSLITGKIDNFKKDVKDNWEARKATAAPGQAIPDTPPAPFDFIASWGPTQTNNSYLSFVTDIYYFIGGAHGITEVHAFNYDMEKKKEITINDFLEGSQQALENLSQLASQQVESELQGNGVEINDTLKQMIEQGVQPNPDNYSDFNFNHNSLTIYFQQYQVAPGYIGPVTITIYKNMLAANSITSPYLK